MKFMCLMGCILLNVSIAIAEVPTAETLLERLTSKTRKWENRVVDSNWLDLAEGKSTNWESQERADDKLGRLYLKVRVGAFDANGNKIQNPKEPDFITTVFDGEKTATLTYHTQKDRLGAEIKSPQQKKGYSTAQIHNDLFPPGFSESYRDPHTFTSAEIYYALQETIKAKRSISLVPAKDNPSLYQLTCSRDKGHEVFGSTQIVALLDPSKDWLPIQVDCIDNSRHIVRRNTCEYKQSDNGLWVPTKGALKHYQNRGISQNPVWENQFVVKKAELNSPNFDETIFQITLSPDTAVSDIRYRSSYRVGDEKVIGSQLNALAIKAKEEMAKNPDIVVSKNIASRPADSKWRWLFVAINIVVLVLISVAIVLRRRSKNAA